ncbi:ATP-binding protein [Mycobacterium sp. 1423905.2]|uniref:ATP-binding protein n=1 Tax=Mycobacterium sp. 1423905.2 TaxID=1856859 RepID=UPI0007FC2BA6|nr:ATP-binding protein [Mycobacterium sp. 1423905.2]OBJ54290.1 anti-sigma regulatory factor [Mycobacterium sp. 1423905.2]
MDDSPSFVADPARLTCVGAADAITAAELRRRLDRWLQQAVHGSAGVRDDIVLSVNEALANCVEHAYRSHHRRGTMRLQASFDSAAQSISVCVSDRGRWHRPAPQRPNDPRASRGIRLMQALADHCTINAHPSGTTVCLDYTTARSDPTWN